jgi:FixJ family two-component response regulator
LKWCFDQSFTQLSHYLETGKNRTVALAELEQIEVLSSLLLPEADNAHNDWFRLTSSEKQVARGILNDVPAHELADELMCTPSHIYNLRSSIRKKWGIESNQALRQAIAERMPKER